MTGILRLSEASIIAFHAMLHVASTVDRTVTSHEIAETYNLSEAHIAKVMQRLVKAGYVSSIRGPGGGFAMARDPETVTLIELYELMEGPLGGSTCFLNLPVCGGGTNCIFGGLVGEMTTMIIEHMTRTTLADSARLNNKKETAHGA